MGDKFRKMSCLNVYGRKRGRVGVKEDFDIIWSVLKQSISYTGGSKRCNLCLEEKLCILKDKNIQNLLSKKSEIVSTCNHRKKHIENNLRNGRNACIV